MVLAVIAGLVYAGYKLTRHTPFGRLVVPPMQPQADEDSTEQSLKERWEEAKQPLTTGMFANKWLIDEPVPYFSTNNVAVSDEHKDIKLALFTGEARDGIAPIGYRASRSRTEVPQIWKPHETATPVPLGSSGSAGIVKYDIQDIAARLPVSSVQNNVNPVGQAQQVAPNRDPLLRVMPINPSTKLPGLLKGLTPAGVCAYQPSVSIEGPPKPVPVSLESNRYTKAMPIPVLNQAATMATSTAAMLNNPKPQQPQNTRDLGSSKPQPQELRGAGIHYAPAPSAFVAEAQLTQRQVAAEQMVASASSRKTQQQTGMLTFRPVSTTTGEPITGSQRKYAIVASQSNILRNDSTAAKPGVVTGSNIKAKALAPLATLVEQAPMMLNTTKGHLNQASTSQVAQGLSTTSLLTQNASYWTAAESAPIRQKQVGSMAFGQSRAFMPLAAAAPPTSAPQTNLRNNTQKDVPQLSSVYAPASNRYMPAAASETHTARTTVLRSERKISAEAAATYREGIPTRIEAATGAVAIQQQQQQQHLAESLRGRKTSATTGQQNLSAVTPTSRAAAQNNSLQQLVLEQPAFIAKQTTKPTGTFAPGLARTLALQEAADEIVRQPVLTTTDRSQQQQPTPQNSTAIISNRVPYQHVPAAEPILSKDHRKAPPVPSMGVVHQAPAVVVPYDHRQQVNMAQDTALQSKTERKADQSLPLVGAAVPIPQAPTIEAPQLLDRKAVLGEARMVPHATYTQQAMNHSPHDTAASTALVYSRQPKAAQQLQQQQQLDHVQPAAAYARPVVEASGASKPVSEITTVPKRAS